MANRVDPVFDVLFSEMNSAWNPKSTIGVEFATRTSPISMFALSNPKLLTTIPSPFDTLFVYCSFLGGFPIRRMGRRVIGTENFGITMQVRSRYRSITSAYYRGAVGAFLVYETNQEAGLLTMSLRWITVT
ncbi:hypothetical protein NC652_018248 [Populus alba x Populus x berolinensis]|nr:hypothetical protein NC652_018248 [Populus alba x Populus x berolinensis]